MPQTVSATGFADHADFYGRGPYAAYLTARRAVGRAPVQMFEVEQPAGHFPDPAMPTALLYLAKRGTKEARFDWGAGRWTGKWRSGDLTLVPPGAASDVTLSGRHSFYGICLPVGLFAEDDDSGDNGTESLGRLYAAPFRDSLLAELFVTLWRESGSDAGDRLFVDSALALMVQRLRLLGRAAALRPSPPGLSRTALNRVAEFIRANLAGPIKIADLAQIAGLGPSQFALQFKRRTGQTPYSYVLAARVEHATDLILTQRTMGLAEIALAAGFSSQSHMTAVFRKITGRTPGAQG